MAENLLQGVSRIDTLAGKRGLIDNIGWPARPIIRNPRHWLCICVLRLGRSGKLSGSVPLPHHRVHGSFGMATHIIMDHTGDCRHYFDTNDEEALRKAEERFKSLTSVGFTAATRTASGDVLVTRSFDPAAEETLFFPRLVGG
jgi:hypothetical protein